MILQCSIVCLSVIFGAQLEDALAPLKLRIAEEARLDCGSVTALVSIDDQKAANTLPPTMRGDLTEPVVLKYVWDINNRFTIQLSRRNGVLLRCIVSDGKFIDTGNSIIWDISCLREAFGDADWSKEAEFWDLMWPFDTLSHHMFPLGRQGLLSHKDYLRGVSLVTGAGDNNSCPIRVLRFAPINALDRSMVTYVFDERLDFSPIVLKASSPQGLAWKSEYSEAFHAGGRVWIPRICRRTAPFKGSGVTLSSEIDVSISEFFVKQTSSFRIDKSDKKRVKYPDETFWDHITSFF